MELVSSGPTLRSEPALPYLISVYFLPATRPVPDIPPSNDTKLSLYSLYDSRLQCFSSPWHSDYLFSNSRSCTLHSYPLLEPDLGYSFRVYFCFCLLVLICIDNVFYHILFDSN